MQTDKDDRLEWSLADYGCIIRGDENTSEDQVAMTATPEIARRMVMCWNAFIGVDTDDIATSHREV